MIEGCSKRPIWARVGRIVKARGLKGDVKVVPDGQDRTSLVPGALLYLEDPSGGLACRVLERVIPLRGTVSAKLKGVNSRNEAEGLVGRSLFVPRSKLPQLPELEFYEADLIGCRVWTCSGSDLGVLTGIIDTKGTDVWVVKGASEELLLPASRDCILEVNVQEGYVVASPLEVDS